MAERPSKRHRATSSEESNDSRFEAINLDHFQQLLRRQQIQTTAEDIPSDGSYQQALAKVQRDRQILEHFRSLIDSQLTAQQSTILPQIHQAHSRFRVLDPAVHQQIVNFLDEEGLWALEASHICEGLEKTDQNWARLGSIQPHAYPRNNMTARERGILFGKASRFARGMETQSRNYYEKPLRWRNGRSSPFDFESFFTLDSSLSDVVFFARMTLRDKHNGPGAVVEGFAAVQERHEDIDSNYILARIHFPGFSWDSPIAKAIAAYAKIVGDAGLNFDPTLEDPVIPAEAIEVARDFGNRFYLTVIAVRANGQMQLVICTTGLDEGRLARDIGLTPKRPLRDARQLEVSVADDVDLGPGLSVFMAYGEESDDEDDGE